MVARRYLSGPTVPTYARVGWPLLDFTYKFRRSDIRAPHSLYDREPEPFSRSCYTPR